MSIPTTTPQVTEIAEAIRTACVETVRTAYDDAGVQGLCAEGRWEYALTALRHLDLQLVVTSLRPSGPTASPDSTSADTHNRCANDG